MPAPFGVNSMVTARLVLLMERMWSPGFFDLRSKTQRGAHPIFTSFVAGARGGARPDPFPPSLSTSTAHTHHPSSNVCRSDSVSPTLTGISSGKRGSNACRAFLCMALRAFFANTIALRELATEAMDVRFPASRAAGNMKEERSAVPKVFA